MSSKSALASPHSSTSKKAWTSRLVLALMCLAVFVMGTVLFRHTSDQQRNNAPEIARRTSENSSAADVSVREAPRSNPQEKHSDISTEHASSRPQEITLGSAKSSTQRRASDRKIGEEVSAESSPKAQASQGQPEEKRQLATQGKSDADKATSEVRPAGRRMRLPRGAQEASSLASQGGRTSAAVATTSGPDAVQLIGPVSQDEDLRKLPYIPPTESEEEETRLKRHPDTTEHGVADPMLPFNPPSLLPSMPSPIRNFDGVTSVTSGSNLIPPDTDGDVGPNHYIQSVNSSIQVFSKMGTTLSGPTTFNSFFSALGPSSPCGTSQNRGDGVVFYDHLANRWVVTDLAFPAFPGTSFYECIGVSKTTDPVSGGWWLYALQTDSSNPSFLGDYPKFGLWPDAYYFAVNLFSNTTTFNGVRVYALNRSAMINGSGSPNPGAVAFSIDPATLGDAYSLLPATFRTGTAPPAGTPEYFLAINSPAAAGTVENQVFAWRFHVDFNTPANSTFGVGASHTPNGTITVNNFVDAFTSSTSNIIPQTPGAPMLDALGDRLMYPVVYQNLSGSESLWASHTVNNNENGTGPTAIRWYQFNVTGSTIPATPVQQQTFNNSADGLWRWMPSIAVDSQGNTSIGYSVSSFTMDPAIRYAGRLGSDPLNSLSQGEAELIAAGGHQADGSGRWGDYSALSIDPSDNCTFWHTNEYYSTTSGRGWNTRIGSFKFNSCGQSCPTVTGTVSGGGTVCSGSSTSVTVNVSGGALPYTVKLTNNGETQSGTASQTQFIFTVSPAVNTTYQIDVVASHDLNNCPLTNSGSASVTVIAGPATPAITTGGAVCAGSTGNQASGPAGATTYAWSILNGTITSATNTQTITYTAGPSGNVTLGLTVTNAAGCGTSNSVGVPINASPATPAIALSGPQTITVTGSSGTFTLTFKGQTTTALAFNASASVVQSKLSALSTIGVGGVTVTLSGNVYTVTFAGLQTGPQPLMTGAGSGGASVAVTFRICAGSTGNQAVAPASTNYAWTISNGTITSATNIQNITYTAGGSGTVTLNLTVTNASACSASNSTIVTTKPIALDRLSQSFAGNGGTGVVNVTPSDGACAWTASTAATFIHVTSGGSGTGNGSVQYSVDVNPGPTVRSNTITIAGQTFTVYQGINFLDVPSNDPFYTDIGKLAARGVTVGCASGNYCPNAPVTREQMAAFILRAIGEFDPPTPPSQRFNDVPPANPFYNSIDRLAVLNITVGCTPDHLFYCPADPVKRDQMSAFILRGLGEFNPPTPATQRFTDVPPSNVFYNFIDRMAVLNITLGCTPDQLMYCPNDSVTRAQMAAFLVRAFGL
jgi:S-layer family protein